MSKRYVIVPYEKAGPVYFGMTRDEVRKLLGQEPHVFRRSSRENESERYDDFFVYYDDEDRCEAVEFWPGNEVVCCGLSLFSRSFEEELSLLVAVDSGVKAGLDCCTSEKLGVGLWSSSRRGPDAQVDSVLAFSHGYFD